MSPRVNLARCHRVVAQRDAPAFAAWLADQAVFCSPVVQTPQAGKACVVALVGAALQVLGVPSFRYVREIAGLAGPGTFSTKWTGTCSGAGVVRRP